MDAILLEWFSLEKQWNEILLTEDEFRQKLTSLLRRLDEQMDSAEREVDRLQWFLLRANDERDSIVNHLERVIK